MIGLFLRPLQAFLAALRRVRAEVFQDPLAGLARLRVVGLYQIIIGPFSAFLPSDKSHKCPYNCIRDKCPRQGGDTNMVTLMDVR